MENLDFKKLSLDDKNLFDGFFKKYPPEVSELTFTNLYIWQKYRRIEYALYEETLILKAETDKETFFFQPVGLNNKKLIKEILEYGAKKNILSIKRAGEETALLSSELGLKVMEDRDSFDYVYKTEDLALLKGRDFSSKRNFVSKFYAEYYHKYWKYADNPGCRKKCLDLTEKWFAERKESDPTLIHEYDALKELFNNYNALNAEGSVICIDEKIVAYTFGEALNNNTFVVHFEKALSNYSGIYQTINKLFAENEILGKFEFINREQDLGIAGIRKAKLSYNPVELIKKYTITL
jgi:uncharacterized protein